MSDVPQYCTAHPAFPPRITVIPESFFSYPDASGEASAPLRSRPLVAGFVLVDGRSLSWKDACATSRDLLLIDALSSQLFSLP